MFNNATRHNGIDAHSHSSLYSCAHIFDIVFSRERERKKKALVLFSASIHCCLFPIRSLVGWMVGSFVRSFGCFSLKAKNKRCVRLRIFFVFHRSFSAPFFCPDEHFSRCSCRRFAWLGCARLNRPAGARLRRCTIASARCSQMCSPIHIILP